MALAVAGAVFPLRAEAQGGSASIVATVIDHESGAPLEGATVTLRSVPDVSRFETVGVSGSDGEVYFDAIPEGDVHVSVVLLGYADLLDTLRIVADSETRLTLPLSVSPVVLEAIVVEVTRRPLGPLRGFEQRRRTVRGSFLTREEIEEANPLTFSDLLRPIPGVRLVPVGSFGQEVYFRGCAPDLWVDGTQVGSSANLDSFLRPEDIEAIEVYRGPELPGEFGTNLCGAIVAWTRRGRTAGADAEGTTIRRQLIMAGSILAAFVGFRVIF